MTETLAEPAYEACSLEMVRDRVKEGTVLQSENAVYKVITGVASKGNMFEVFEESSQ